MPSMKGSQRETSSPSLLAWVTAARLWHPQLLGGGKGRDFSLWECLQYHHSIVCKLWKCLHLVSSIYWRSFPSPATHRDTSPALLLAKPLVFCHSSWVTNTKTYWNFPEGLRRPLVLNCSWQSGPSPNPSFMDGPLGKENSYLDQRIRVAPWGLRRGWALL